ncbi:MAG TPA: amidohydrolase family protein [Armatimonadota bacterium]|nr:amidohydrolase family protein [Armatimonadota bacterium]
MSTTLAQLREYLADLPVVSVHEHHREDDAYRDLSLEGLFLRSYVGWAYPGHQHIADREGFLDHVRFNAYFVWLQQGLQRIYGCPAITPRSWDAVSAQITAAHHASPTWHLDVMRRHGRYRRAIQDAFWHVGSDVGHPEFFSPAFRINAFVMCHHPDMADHNGTSLARFDLPWGCFSEYVQAVKALIRRARANGAVAMKSALAYDRDLAFAPATYDDAARAFGKRPDAVDDATRRAYQDFMFHVCCEIAAELQLPFQHHTGLGLIGGSNPMKLEPAIRRHPETTFVLFHGGYPWVQEIAGLAHNYPNVLPDLTWLPLIAPTAAVGAIHEWVEAAQTARGICWGGDAFSGEESVGAALALKHVLATALAHKVDEGYFGLEDAQLLARMICSENAERVYGLTSPPDPLP